MKKTLMTILKYIIKAIYIPIRVTKRLSKFRQTPDTRRELKRSLLKNKDTVNNNTSRTRFNPNKKPLWKDKRVVVGSCALVIIITAVLAISLPRAGFEVYASDVDDKYASMADVQANTIDNYLSESSSGETEVASLSQDINIESSVVDYEMSVVKNTPIPTTTPVPTPIKTTAPDESVLAPGCHDSRIVEIQQRLMELGYMGEDEPTDYYGWGTEYGLQLFQRKHYLQVDGLAGEITLMRLFADGAMPYTVKLKDRGTDVQGLQERLIELRYLKSSTTGYFGTDTETAVKNFQKRNGLTVDGNVGAQTREVLYSEDAKAAPKPSVSSSGGSSSDPSGKGSGGGGSIAKGNPDKASADALIEFALSLKGSRYVLGAKGPNSFDCSGFVYYCLNRVGYSIRYMTSGGWAKCSLPKVTSMQDMKRGDIICFRGHVGIYMGNGKMVDASSSSGQIVTRNNIFSSSYWTRNFICARRVF